MHISKLYLQDNFVPNYDIDPFRRKVCGMEVIIQEKETLEDAIIFLEEKISNYIKANTILPSGEMKGTHVTIINPEQEEQIQKEFAELEIKLRSFEFQEDAQWYLETTGWKYELRAKQIVSSLPLKNK